MSSLNPLGPTAPRQTPSPSTASPATPSASAPLFSDGVEVPTQELSQRESVDIPTVGIDGTGAILLGAPIGDQNPALIKFVRVENPPQIGQYVYFHPPRIDCQEALLSFLRSIQGAGPKAVFGCPKQGAKLEAMDKAVYCSVTFSGIVFRGDTRPFEEIKDNGFISKNSLSPSTEEGKANLAEARGFGVIHDGKLVSAGATGTSGVSCSTNLDATVAYCMGGGKV